MSPIAVVLIAIGGALLMEGAAFAIFPAQLRRAYQMVLSGNNKELHIFGLINVALGVMLVSAAVKFFG